MVNLIFLMQFLKKHFQTAHWVCLPDSVTFFRGGFLFGNKRILSVVAASGKVYATHLRNEKDDIIPSVEETLKIAEETGFQQLSAI